MTWSEVANEYLRKGVERKKKKERNEKKEGDEKEQITQMMHSSSNNDNSNKARNNRDIKIGDDYEPNDENDLLRSVDSALLDLKSDVIESMTVDKWQGRDKDVIIISTCSSISHHHANVNQVDEGSATDLLNNSAKNKRQSLLADLQRLNVALTRAKKKLIIIGSGQGMKAMEPTQKLLEIIQGKGWVVNLFDGDKG